jgi:hypothetical protein
LNYTELFCFTGRKSSHFFTFPIAKSQTRNTHHKNTPKGGSAYSTRRVALPVLTSGEEEQIARAISAFEQNAYLLSLQMWSRRRRSGCSSAFIRGQGLPLINALWRSRKPGRWNRPSDRVYNSRNTPRAKEPAHTRSCGSNSGLRPNETVPRQVAIEDGGRVTYLGLSK